MLPEDERALLRALARHELSLYPEIFAARDQRRYPPTRRRPGVAGRHGYYLAAERLGPLIVRPLGRGRDKGMLEIAEVPSPVFHYERSCATTTASSWADGSGPSST